MKRLFDETSSSWSNDVLGRLLSLQNSLTTLLDFYKQKNTKQVKAEEQEKLKQKKLFSHSVGCGFSFWFGIPT